MTLVAENTLAPDRAAFNSELKEVVTSALETLSPMERSAFVLRHYEGLSIEEIGAVLGLKVNAGHGLNYHNVIPIAAIPGVAELNIGHAIVAHALFVGFGEAVREMKALMRAARKAHA